MEPVAQMGGMEKTLIYVSLQHLQTRLSQGVGRIMLSPTSKIMYWFEMDYLNIEEQLPICIVPILKLELSGIK